MMFSLFGQVPENIIKFRHNEWGKLKLLLKKKTKRIELNRIIIII